MFDWLNTNEASGSFALEAPGSATVLIIVAFLSLFAMALAERIFRYQRLGVFAGLAAGMQLTAIFALLTIGQVLLELPWVQKLTYGELFFHLFCLGVSALWLGAILSSSRLPEPPHARHIFFWWQVTVWSLLAVVLGCGASEGYGIFHFVLNEAIRQTLVGISAGTFIIAGALAIYRLWRERAALWLWLAFASFVFAGSVSFFYFAPLLPLLGYAAFGLAALLTIIGLFRDHVRFLRFESELRSGLLENTIKLEEKISRQAALLEFSREAVVHLDRDERVVYANANFLQLLKILTPAGNTVTQATSSVKPHANNAGGQAALPATSEASSTTTSSDLANGSIPSSSAIEGKRLSMLLPRELYNKLIPVVQEARRGRPLLLEISYHRIDQEKLLQVFSTPLYDRVQKISGFHLSLLDLTTRYLAKRSLEETLVEKTQELRIFQQSIENAGEAVVMTDLEPKIIYTNEAFERITGFTRTEILGRDPQVYHPDLPLVKKIKEGRGLLPHKSWRGEVSSRRKDGSMFISDLSVIPVEDTEKKIIRYLWIERDITDRKDLEGKLHQLAEALEAKSNEIARAKQEYEGLQARAKEQQRRIDQLSKLMEIGEDIRLNVGIGQIMQSVSDAVVALGWQRVLVFQRRDNDLMELMASTGFANRSAPSYRQLRSVPYSEFAAYLLERFRISQSFFIDSGKLAEVGSDLPLLNKLRGAGAFVPARPSEFSTPSKFNHLSREWLSNDALFVPIRVRDQMVGLIAVFSPIDGRRPDLQRIRDLEIFADDAAIAIENSRLLALHQRNERQAHVLADIGKAFRAAGTVEQAVSDIAGISAQAFELPCVVVVRAMNEKDWFGALGLVPSSRDKNLRPRSRLLEASEISATFLSRLATANEGEITTIELNRADWPWPASGEPFPSKASDKLSAQVTVMRSRGRNVGFMAYLLSPEDDSPVSWQPDEVAFAIDIADRATLTIENARLFIATEEKALALERANLFISEFLASVSHELRTPMHSILQFSEILLSQASGSLNSEQKHQIEVIQRSGKNLLALLNDILDLSKIEAGKMEAVIEKFNPAQLIQEATESIRPLCEQKHLLLQVGLDENLPAEFCSDRSMLSRVLMNLLGNAVKFTPSGQGEIEVLARMRRNLLVISVRDSGIGIPLARRKEIFEPFHQLESSETRKHGGTGLGLAISKKLLAILNGEIEVESAPGKGSTFTIRVPGSASPAVAKNAASRSKFPKKKVEARSEQQPQKDESKESAAKKEKPAIRLPAAINRELIRAKAPRILVVEDDENTRYAMQFILENAGYQVDFAEGGEKALLAAQHHRPDLILMDIMMPNMDGYQVARMLKAQKQLAHIPVIALTARAMKGDREKALAAGCNDYLTKPFESKDILNMLEKWLG